MAFGITAIKEIINDSKETLHIVKKENPDNDRLTIHPGYTSGHEIWIPWVGNQNEFDKKVLEITFAESKNKICIWQSGNTVRYSKGSFSDGGFAVAPMQKTDGERKLTITDTKVIVEEYNN